jgi:hypothetical protein
MRIATQLLRPLFPLLLGADLAVGAVAATEDERDGFVDDLEARIARVNEGALEFLSEPPAQPVHHHQNILTLDDASLEHGWARLDQCHEHLDAVPRAEVTFREGFLRNLVITESSHIRKAWVEGDTVQLEGVEHGARLCLKAESRVLSHNEDGSYSVRNGPYMRRFLDGYYPMRVSVEVRYPCSRVRLTSLSPPAQDGFRVTQAPCRVYLDAWFRGRLRTELRFVDRTPAM